VLEARSDGTIPTAAEKRRSRAILTGLVARYPEIHTALDYDTAWHLLVSTVLSAQTTDDTVNRVAPILFARFPNPEDLAVAPLEEVEEIVFSTGFYRQKAAAIVALAGDLVDKFGGQVPRDLDSLVKLKGVGRKTASVVLAEVWAIPAIAVDTHVRRVSGRLGLTASDDPAKIEQDLKALFPRRSWAGVSLRMIQFGRDVCDARAPRCSECEFRRRCPWPNKPI
jgi:endonuclease-3